MNPDLPPVARVALRLLDCVETTLADHGRPVCRAFWHPGDQVPWDACNTTTVGGEGQAWVATGRVFPTDSFPNENVRPERCIPREHGINLLVGTLRCAATVDDHGRAPAVERVTADAVKQTLDRESLYDAIVCCLGMTDAEPEALQLREWIPLGPEGGCVGGQWRILWASPTPKPPA